MLKNIQLKEVIHPYRTGLTKKLLSNGNGLCDMKNMLHTISSNSIYSAIVYNNAAVEISHV